MGKYGVNVPPGIPVFKVDEVAAAAEKMASPDGEVGLLSVDAPQPNPCSPGHTVFHSCCVPMRITSTPSLNASVKPARPARPRASRCMPSQVRGLRQVPPDASVLSCW